MEQISSMYEKIPAVGKNGEEVTKNRGGIPMTVIDFITQICTSKAFYRKIVVRAIEDAIILACFFIALAGVCAICSLCLKLLGVA